MSNTELLQCDTCIKQKMVHPPTPKTNVRDHVVQPFETLYTDIFGQIKHSKTKIIYN